MYRAQEDRWAVKTAGFLLAPAAVAITAGTLTSSITGKPIDMSTSVLIYGGAAVLLWMASERAEDVTLQAFARGGAWGAITGLAFIPFTAALAAQKQGP